MKKKKLLTFFGCLALCIFFAIETKAQNRKSVTGAEVTGTFRTKDGDEFKVAALGKGKLRIAFSGVYMHKTASGENMPNTGEASGTAVVAGDTATFKPADFQQCAITLRFLTRSRLKVTQSGNDTDCGFGANVSASGTYKKISGRRPKF
jgi:hypothetical protein